jgi:hypothetical protein
VGNEGTETLRHETGPMAARSISIFLRTYSSSSRVRVRTNGELDSEWRKEGRGWAARERWRRRRSWWWSRGGGGCRRWRCHPIIELGLWGVGGLAPTTVEEVGVVGGGAVVWRGDGGATSTAGDVWGRRGRSHHGGKKLHTLIDS